MPKKTAELQAYGVFPQNREVPIIFKKAIHETILNFKECQVGIEDGNFGRQSAIDSLDCDIDSILTPIPEFFINTFDKNNHVIVSQRLAFSSSEDIDFAKILSTKTISDIQSAILGQEIFNWSEFVYGYFDYDKSETLYLLDKYLWVFPDRKSVFFNEEERKLLILEEIDKERTKFEKLKRKFSGSIRTDDYNLREPIPEDVRIFVWRRDSGKCVKCGSQTKLEYDHIIPIIKGGSNTARNIQLLCERCNRSKGASI